MRKLNSLAGILAIALLSFSSCSKEKATPPTQQPTPEPTKEELLAGSGQKTWHLTKYYYDGVEKTSEIKACQMDDNYIYKKDGNYEVTGGASKCDAMEKDQLETATWWFNTEKTNINMKYTWNGQSMSYALKIDELTANSMKLSMTYENHVYTHVYTAQ
jgi:hypothetical protein